MKGQFQIDNIICQERNTIGPNRSMGTLLLRMFLYSLTVSGNGQKTKSRTRAAGMRFLRAAAEVTGFDGSQKRCLNRGLSGRAGANSPNQEIQTPVVRARAAATMKASSETVVVECPEKRDQMEKKKENRKEAGPVHIISLSPISVMYFSVCSVGVKIKVFSRALTCEEFSCIYGNSVFFFIDVLFSLFLIKVYPQRI